MRHKPKPKIARRRAVKVRPVRPLDVARSDNHAARHEEKKLERALLEQEAVVAATLAEAAGA